MLEEKSAFHLEGFDIKDESLISSPSIPDAAFAQTRFYHLGNQIGLKVQSKTFAFNMTDQTPKSEDTQVAREDAKVEETDSLRPMR